MVAWMVETKVVLLAGLLVASSVDSMVDSMVVVLASQKVEKLVD